MGLLDLVQQVLSVVAIAALAIAFLTWQSTRSRPDVEEWAARNGFELLGSEHRSVVRGPFTWGDNRLDVHYVAVRDARGRVRTGWVSFPPHLGPANVDRAQVRWEPDTAEGGPFPPARGR